MAASDLNSADILAAGGDPVARQATQFVSNAIPQLMTKWRRALAGIAANDGVPYRVLTVSDSTGRTPYDTPSTIGGPMNGGADYAWPSLLAREARAAGIKATANAIYGMNSFTPAQYIAYDPSVALGAGWVASANQSIGGSMFANTTDTTAFSKTFADAFNTIVVRHRQQPTAGQFTVDVGGAVLQTVTTTGADGMASTTISTGAAAAIGTVNIKRVSGTVEIIGFEAYDSANPGLICINGGRGGWGTQQYNFFNEGWRPGSAIKLIAPDLAILALGVNDVNRTGADPAVPTTPLPLFTSGYQNIITQLSAVQTNPASPAFGLPTGSNLLMLTFVPQDLTFATAENQETYRREVIRLAEANGFPCLDRYGRLESRAKANAIGLYGDARHPNRYGHADDVRFIGNAIFRR